MPSEVSIIDNKDLKKSQCGAKIHTTEVVLLRILERSPLAFNMNVVNTTITKARFIIPSGAASIR